MSAQLSLTAYDLAERFKNLREAPGAASNAQVLAMLRLDVATVAGDDVPWCSAFVNYVAWLLNLPRSRSLAARSWLNVGTPIVLADAVRGFDIVILKRGLGPQPGPEVTSGAPGHVGFFDRLGTGADASVFVLGGNQGDAVTVARFPRSSVLGVRRLHQLGEVHGHT